MFWPLGKKFDFSIDHTCWAHWSMLSRSALYGVLNYRLSKYFSSSTVSLHSPSVLHTWLVSCHTYTHSLASANLSKRFFGIWARMQVTWPDILIPSLTHWWNIGVQIGIPSNALCVYQHCPIIILLAQGQSRSFCDNIHDWNKWVFNISVLQLYILR